MDSTESKIDVYQIVTDRIIELLDQGTIPWQKPWTVAGIPMNAISKRPYRGINFWLLLSLNYERNLFLSWDQLKKLGGSVKQGEHGHVVIFWKIVKKDDNPQTKKQKDTPMLRYYKVFNVEQCRELPKNLVEPLLQVEHNPLLECEAIINEMPGCPPVKHKEQKAFYHIVDDYINMPKKKSFTSSESYFSTLFHELVHSTGHEKRLNRPTISEMAEFGSELYSIEELVAELGAAYLCSFTGILGAQINNSAAYIKGWLCKLKDDKKFIVRASGYSQRAVDCILNLPKPEIESKEEVEPSEVIVEA